MIPGRLLRPVAGLAALLCAGCEMSWPAEGGGGMAEYRAPMAPPDAMPPQGLAYQMACTLGRLNRLRDTAAGIGQHTGEIRVLDGDAARAQREYAGQLYRDSTITLDALSNGINQVLAEMDRPPEAECS